MPSPKKQPTKSRIHSSFKAYAKTPNGHVFFRSCGVGMIVLGAFLSLFCFVSALAAAFTSNALFNLLIFMHIVFLVFSILGCVVAIANHTALRKARGRHQLPSVTPRWLSRVYATIAATLIIGAVAAAIFYLFVG